jgi:hypothetical protein
MQKTSTEPDDSKPDHRGDQVAVVEKQSLTILKLEGELVRLQEKYLALQKDRLIDNICSLGRDLFKWSAFCFLAFMSYLSVKKLAGLETVALIKGIVDINIDEPSLIAQVVNALPTGVALACICYGIKQRKLRGDAIKQMDAHKKMLEESYDPNRSSSKLTDRGDTQDDDL